MAIKQENKLFTNKEIHEMLYGSGEKRQELLMKMIHVLEKRKELKSEYIKWDNDSKAAKNNLIDWIQENDSIRLDNGIEISVDYYKGHAYLKVTQSDDYE